MRLADAYDEKICVTEIDHARLDDTRRGERLYFTRSSSFFSLSIIRIKLKSNHGFLNDKHACYCACSDARILHRKILLKYLKI